MKHLTILRHAKSSWDDPDVEDFDRPLNKRGRKAAVLVGSELKRRNVRFDLVVASPAARVRETLERLFEGFGETLDVSFDERIYEASEATLLEIVQGLPASSNSPLIVGHNPALERLVVELTHDDDRGFRNTVAKKFPTAAVAVIELRVSGWAEIAAGSGEIVDLILPREL